MSRRFPRAHDLPAIEKAAATWLAELGIERAHDLTAIEQVELLVWGGHLPESEWVERSMSANGDQWDGIGPTPRWSGLGVTKVKKRRR